MEMSLVGKRALVCGSSKGIGRASAIALSQLGASIVLLSRDENGLLSTKALLNTSQGQQHDVLVADLNNRQTLKVMIEEYLLSNPIQIIINNTGGPKYGPLLSASEDDFLTAIGMHVGGAQVLANACLPFMKKSNYGRIVNIISTSVKAPIPGLGVSNTTRGAMASWAKTLAGELGPSGITVNNVLPGFTSTYRLD